MIEKMFQYLGNSNIRPVALNDVVYIIKVIHIIPTVVKKQLFRPFI